MTAPTDFPIVVTQGGLLNGAGGDFVLEVFAGLAVAVLSFVLGFNRGKIDKSIHDDHSTRIYVHIQNLALYALSATSDEVRSRAQMLRAGITETLGPLLVVSKGIGTSLKTLEDAFEGMKTVDRPKAAEPPRAATQVGCGCGQPKVCACAVAPVPPPTMTINQVYVGGTPVPAAHPAPACQASAEPPRDHGREPPRGAHDDKPASEKQAMSPAEQTEAIGKAVRQFADHWSHRAQRIQELKDARAALSRRPPTPLPQPTERRVWDRL